MASTMKSVKESTRSLLALLANSFFSVTANSFCNSDHMVGITVSTYMSTYTEN
jgi:hypothetical protein